MKICELCKSKARIHCESDDASLCWVCDFKVHSANFLVAKHLRSLLCHVCQCPTAWNASGEKLGRTISVCDRCVGGCVGREESSGGNGDQIEADEIKSGGDCDEDGENQLVPMSDTSDPPAASSSSEASSTRFRNGNRDICLKRLREKSVDLCSEDDRGCSSSDKNISSSKLTDAVAERCVKSSLIDSMPGRSLKRQIIDLNQSQIIDLNQSPEDQESYD